eukprot:Skav220935  [mRNA]  locus=scaffold3184:312642:314624:- [translate_table: standard]
MAAKKKRKVDLGAASDVCEDTLGLHSVSDDSRRKIFNATCKALNKPEHQVDRAHWQQIAQGVLPEVSYPVELPGVVESEPVTFYMCDIKKTLQVIMEKCSSYAMRIQKLSNQTPGIIYDMLLYNDEASGGNIVSPDNAKKVSLWYYSLRQVGYTWSDCCWHPLALLQHTMFEKIQGGFSAFAKRVILELVDQKLGIAFPVRFPTGMGMLRLSFTYMISDRDSIRYALDAKSSAGIRCCIHCKNAVKKDTDVPNLNDYFQDICSNNWEGFHEQTDGDIFAVVDYLALVAPGLSKAALKKKEIAAGFRLNPDGLLLHQLARDRLPPSSFLLDTMHLYWSNCIVSWEIVEIYNCWSKQNLGDLKGFLAMDWHTSMQDGGTPSWRQKLGHESNFTGNSYKGSASNLRAFFPLFHFFLSRVLDGTTTLQKEKDSFNALRRITLELRRLQGECGIIATEKYQQLQTLHHDLVVKAYTTNFIKPKHHARFHQADQMKRVGAHYDSFAGERKHKTFKSHIGLHRFDTWAQNEHGKFGELCMRAIWQHHVSSLSSFKFETALLGTTVLSRQVSDALGQTDCKTSLKISHEGRTFTENDVLLGKHPGIFLSAVETKQSDFYVLLQPLEMEQRTEFWSYWKISGNKKLVPIHITRMSVMLPKDFLASHSIS